MKQSCGTIVATDIPAEAKWAASWQNQQSECALSEDSAKPEAAQIPLYGV